MKTNIVAYLIIDKIQDLAGVITGLFTWVLVFLITKFYGKTTLTGFIEEDLEEKEKMKTTIRHAF